MSGNGTGRLQPLPLARYVIADEQDDILCVKQ